MMIQTFKQFYVTVASLVLLAVALAGCSQDTDRADEGSLEEMTTETSDAKAYAAESADHAAKGVASATHEPNPPVIVMLGDSLTAGFGLSQEDALPTQLENTLAERGVAVRIINAGVSGDTTGGGLERYDWSVAGANADLLVIALGANDYLQGKPVDTAEKNLRAILARAQADELPVALIGLQPRSQGKASQRDAAFAEIYPKLAQEFSAPLYPAMLEGVRGNPALLQADGLHPTSEGAAIIASAMAGFLETQIDALPTP